MDKIVTDKFPTNQYIWNHITEPCLIDKGGAVDYYKHILATYVEENFDYGFRFATVMHGLSIPQVEGKEKGGDGENRMGVYNNYYYRR
jgi:hypothetical protein